MKGIILPLKNKNKGFLSLDRNPQIEEYSFDEK
jgi:hypothetical protein